MIELKLSQGAKPGHGGVLPAEKNSDEIARIRHVEPHTTIISPPGHREFEDAAGLLHFIRQLRELAEGKPVGFKLCLGREEEFTEICRQMQTTGIQPDFITIDGAEGGTGAAPLEYSDSVGIPLEPALKFAHRTLQKFDLRKDIRLIASGKVLTAFSLMKLFAYGADTCNAARAFMLAVGCIQALRCDTNNCPTGVATQDPALVRGLVVADKKQRVANFHRNTVKSVLGLMAACGVSRLEDINPDILLHGWAWKPEGGPRPG
jgi:glutamate synthase domain-containing protein 2